MFAAYNIYCRSHCEGDSKATNALRQLLVCLATGSVPASWRAEYTVPSEISVGAWVADLVARCGALMRYKPIIRGVKGEKEGLQYWMGGMFTPYCFITATRQHSAQVCSVTLFFIDRYVLAVKRAYQT